MKRTGKKYKVRLGLAGILAGLLLMGMPHLQAQPREAGKSAPAPSQTGRFVDNGDQTITDTQTGLMWTRMDSYQMTGHWISWFGSFEFVQKLNEDGYAHHHDWQMPTLKDLQTLYESDKINSQQVGREMVIHIDPVFAKEGAGSIWSSEPNGRFNAFGVVFNHGKRFSAPKKSKARKAVRAMRVVHP